MMRYLDVLSGILDTLLKESNPFNRDIMLSVIGWLLSLVLTSWFQLVAHFELSTQPVR